MQLDILRSLCYNFSNAGDVLMNQSIRDWISCNRMQRQHLMSGAYAKTMVWPTAFKLAHERHWGQKRANNMTYLTHIASTVRILRSNGYADRDVILTIAALHDVVEDTNTTLAEIDEKFGATVAFGVDRLTEKDGLPKEEYFAGIFACPEAEVLGVPLVKLADRIDNLRTLTNFKNVDKVIRKIRETEEYICPHIAKYPILGCMLANELEVLKRNPSYAGHFEAKEFAVIR